MTSPEVYACTNRVARRTINTEGVQLFEQIYDICVLYIVFGHSFVN